MVLLIQYRLQNSAIHANTGNTILKKICAGSLQLCHIDILLNDCGSYHEIHMTSLVWMKRSKPSPKLLHKTCTSCRRRRALRHGLGHAEVEARIIVELGPSTYNVSIYCILSGSL